MIHIYNFCCCYFGSFVWLNSTTRTMKQEFGINSTGAFEQLGMMIQFFFIFFHLYKEEHDMESFFRRRIFQQAVKWQMERRLYFFFYTLYIVHKKRLHFHFVIEFMHEIKMIISLLSWLFFFSFVSFMEKNFRLKIVYG